MNKVLSLCALSLCISTVHLKASEAPEKTQDAETQAFLANSGRNKTTEAAVAAYLAVKEERIAQQKLIAQANANLKAKQEHDRRISQAAADQRKGYKKSTPTFTLDDIEIYCSECNDEEADCRCPHAGPR